MSTAAAWRIRCTVHTASNPDCSKCSTLFTEGHILCSCNKMPLTQCVCVAMVWECVREERLTERRKLRGIFSEMMMTGWRNAVPSVSGHGDTEGGLVARGAWWELNEEMRTSVLKARGVNSAACAASWHCMPLKLRPTDCYAANEVSGWSFRVTRREVNTRPLRFHFSPPVCHSSRDALYLVSCLECFGPSDQISVLKQVYLIIS